jgi:hypothetical protein
MSQFSRGGGHNSLHVDREIDSSWPNQGYLADIPLNIDAFTLTTGAQLAVTAATNNPFRTPVQGSIHGIRWNATVAVGSVVTQIKLPGEYDPTIDDVVFIGTFRHSGTDADAARNFRLRADYFQPGHVLGTVGSGVTPAGANIIAGEATVQTIDPTVSTAVTVGANAFGIPPGSIPANTYIARQLAARENPGTAAGFLDYQFPLAFGTPAKATEGTNGINRFKPLSILTLTLSNDVAASTNNVLDFLGGVLRFRRNSSLNARDRRYDRTRVR